MALIAADYQRRAMFATNAAFVQRVFTAALKVATVVATEAENTADHAVRNKLAGHAVLRTSEISQRLASLMSALITVEMDDVTYAVSTPLTDAELHTWLVTNWTAIAKAVVGL